MATDCLFCKIIGGQLPATVVYRDDRLIAIRDLNPVAPTHILFITIRHIASIAEAEAEPAGAELIGALHLAAVKVAEQEGLVGCCTSPARNSLLTGRIGGSVGYPPLEERHHARPQTETGQAET